MTITKNNTATYRSPIQMQPNTNSPIYAFNSISNTITLKLETFQFPKQTTRTKDLTFDSKTATPTRAQKARARARHRSPCRRLRRSSCYGRGYRIARASEPAPRSSPPAIDCETYILRTSAPSSQSLHPKNNNNEPINPQPNPRNRAKKRTFRLATAEHRRGRNLPGATAIQSAAGQNQRLPPPAAPGAQFSTDSGDAGSNGERRGRGSGGGGGERERGWR